MFDRAEHCRRIASLGGKAVVAKYGSDHMRRIGAKGAHTTWSKYRLVPINRTSFVMVDKVTNTVVASFPHSDLVKTPV